MQVEKYIRQKWEERWMKKDLRFKHTKLFCSKPRQGKRDSKIRHIKSIHMVNAAITSHNIT